MHSIEVSDQKMSFSSAHFVMGADYCENLHGHNYSVSARIEGEINQNGMVMDFREVKKHVIQICKILDHKVVLPGESELIKITEKEQSIEVIVQGKRYLFPIEDCIIIPAKATTAELLAQWIATQLRFTEGTVVEVCVSESIGARGCFRTKFRS